MASSARPHQGADSFDPMSSCVSEFREFILARDDDAGVIFISCTAIPELFIAVADESSIRGAIDTGLKNAFTQHGLKAAVYTNGSIAGPEIHAVVKLTK